MFKSKDEQLHIRNRKAKKMMKAMNTSYLHAHSSGEFSSPDKPRHETRSLRICEGWSSVRIPPCRYGCRSYINPTTLMPSSSGRALPSKWDDAERWISSPGLGNGNSRIPLVQSRRRTKSKSGPLGPSGLAFCGSSSPVLPAVIGGSVRNSVALDSLCSVREIPGKRFSISDEGGRKSSPGNAEQDLGFSHERLEMLRKHASLILQVVICLEPINDMSRGSAANGCGIGVGEVLSTLKKNQQKLEQELEISAETQMLSEGSSGSSPIQRSSFSSLSSPMKIRDVQGDREANAIRSSKKSADTMRNYNSPHIKVLCHNATDKDMAKLHREDAKINAWENLQKAKAEAAIRKLEMKLEKKRSSSMDKIMKKLRRAQLKAEKKRMCLSETHCNEISRCSSKMAFLQKYLDKLNKQLEQMLC
ncbi:hypothetical protein Ancab_025991 [Ancistrocladus abbreviatus]